METTNYNDISAHYSAYWHQKVTENIGYQALLAMIGDCTDKHILDYGCGSGDMAKTLHVKGAKIQGVDVSENMIQTAKENLPGVEFLLIDSQYPFKYIQKELFDIITMNYVLCVLPEKDEIKDIIRGAYDSLISGGELYIQNANWDKANGYDFMSYKLHFKENLKDGDKIFVTLKLDQPLEIEDYFFSQETYRKRLYEIGFSHVVVHELYGKKEDGREEESRTSPCYIIEAIK